MEYMLLIHGSDAASDAIPEAERAAMYEEYFALSRELRDRGAYVSSNELEPRSTATAVKVRDGETIVTDGPYTETKEGVGGYYLIEAESLDEAIEWAARIPSARTAWVEVRPVVVHESAGAS